LPERVVWVDSVTLSWYKTGTLEKCSCVDLTVVCDSDRLRMSGR
jgi:hypothetical protein